MTFQPVQRRRTREVSIGPLTIGGQNPIWVQSMCSTHTEDVEATLAQCRQLEAAGCEIVRVTVPRAAALAAVGQIRRRIGMPLVCDVHFDFRLALACLEQPCEKIRINPGNIGGRERFLAVVRKARETGKAMRIGVNAGSLERDLLDKYGWPCAAALVESALRYIELAEAEGYDRIVVSLKSSDVPTVVEAYRRFADACDYPTHLGVTEAGTAPEGLIKSAAGLGSLLLDGIGDTLRVSLLTADKTDEVRAGFDILQATRRRVVRPEVIACPTCGRLEVDLERIVSEVKRRISGLTLPVRISILGCVVNGPGEAKEADIGLAAGRGKGVIFRKGQPVRTVPEEQLVDALMEELARWQQEQQGQRLAQPAGTQA